MQYSVRGILLDIEGTTSSISFVYDEMFPFVRRELAAYLETHWGEPDLITACEQVAVDAGHDSLAAWTGSDGQRAAVQGEVLRLMDNDVKATGLKMLQGQIWKSGFQSGELVAHVYDDVVGVLQKWQSAGIDIRIYSSGSVQAQKLFFGHTREGSLLDLFRGHYDTKIGSKREADSYSAIVDEFQLPANQILFVSDVVAELEAAASSGLSTALCVRPGNAKVDGEHSHPVIHEFTEIEVVTGAV